MSKENCNCEWCQHRSPLLSKINNFLNENEKKILDDMIGDLMTAETDAVYWKDKYYGTWPSDTIQHIENHILRLKERIKEMRIIEELESQNDYKNSLKNSKE